MTDNYVTSIDIDSKGSKWISTHGGGIYKYDDINWINFNPDNSFLKIRNVISIKIDANDNKYIGSGGDGLFIYNEEGIVISVDEKTETTTNSYELSQNYPNPFNPITSIKYQIPEDGMVTLKIYDILGKEVKTLVNEQKSAGRYEVRFDAADLATGVYLYKLNVNNFASVKKMLLVK
ncbi:MAG: T9SS type A sorting domain-containing protein [Ignavibacteriaceae bacterium]